MNDFLPQGYEAPKNAGNYMKLQDGLNRLRILGSAIVGWEYWVEDKEGKAKPVRSKEAPNGIPADSREGAKPKHFWAIPVWNYDADAVQILEITQSTIQDAIRTLAEDNEWGDPKNYDLKITRSGKDLETKYQVSPAPAAPLAEVVAAAWKATTLNLEALYENGDPFEGAKPKEAYEASPEVPAV